MLYLEIKGRPLLLPATTSATVEHLNPLFADGLEDSFSLPFDLPAEGNEEALGHVHQLPLRNRPKEFRQARMGYDGQPMYPGILHVLATTPRTVRTTFLLEAIVSRLGELTVPEALAGETIDLLDELVNQSISLHLRPSYRDGGKCQFPMFLAEDLYDGANEYWSSDASEYNENQSYALNDEVIYAIPAAVTRKAVWQCIDPAGAAAFQRPDTHPLKWRKLQYALVNAWDRENNQHYYNSGTGNFYTWVPWFYLKWVLKKCVEKIGYTLEGEWMDDPRWDEFQLANLTTIDAASVPMSEQGFAARQTTAVPYDPIYGYAVYRMPAQDDSTPPLGDTTAMWDTTAMTWTCPVAGVWRFRVRWAPNRMVPAATGAAGSQYYRYVVHLRNTSTGAIRSYAIRDIAPSGERSQTMELTVQMSAGDVGSEFHLVGFQMRYGGFAPTAETLLWPTLDTDQYDEVELRAWLEETVPTVMKQDSLITVSRHMPQRTVADLIMAAIDLWNLEPVPDETLRVLRLDYRQTAIEQAHREQTDQSERLIGETEVDLQRRVKGVRLNYDLDDLAPTGDVPELMEESYTEQDMPAAYTTNQKRVCKATRRLYTSVFRSGSFVWEPSGYLVPPVLIGEKDGAQEITPEFKPLHMVELSKDEREYIVPVVPGEGTSAWYNVETELTEFYLCEFKKQRSYDGTVTNVPGARSWGYGWDAEDTSGNTLLWNANEASTTGLYQRNWQYWLDFLTNAEPVTMDLVVDTPFLRGKAWRRVMNIHGSRYLMERMPVDYGPHTGALVSRGAYAYRLMPSLLDSSLPPDVFDLCGTCHLVSEEAMCITLGDVPGGPIIGFGSNTDYMTVIDSSGNRTIYNTSGGNVSPGSYCVYPSSSDGTPSGVWMSAPDTPGSPGGATFTGLSSIYGGVFNGTRVGIRFYYLLISEFVVPPTPSCGEFQITNGTCTSVDATAVSIELIGMFILESCPNLTSIMLTGNFQHTYIKLLLVDLPSFTSDAVDDIANRLGPSFSGEVYSPGTASPTAASQANRQALYDSGNWALPDSWMEDLVL